ncbi:hypothetical protein [Streptomyces sp. NBC_01506]|uniref:hypothetical protein n=1 Tax=Streptomyces sp. NBC_01506 TaxID=2903887 RepID=UPI002F9138A2
MTHVFYSDAAEKILGELSSSEQAAVESVRRFVEEDPDSERARDLPDADPRSSSWVIELLPDETGGRGISVVYRFDSHLDAALILWLMSGDTRVSVAGDMAGVSAKRTRQVLAAGSRVRLRRPDPVFGCRARCRR